MVHLRYGKGHPLVGTHANEHDIERVAKTHFGWRRIRSGQNTGDEYAFHSTPCTQSKQKHCLLRSQD